MSSMTVEPMVVATPVIMSDRRQPINRAARVKYGEQRQSITAEGDVIDVGAQRTHGGTC